MMVIGIEDDTSPNLLAPLQGEDIQPQRIECASASLCKEFVSVIRARILNSMETGSTSGSNYSSTATT
ncbi:hypothetical protein TNCV_4527171 [Trichonephila clavipes]|nr:hypothetical protein TNCV_4527171 [Trichonephila clavipes]